jgi:predicted helicase
LNTILEGEISGKNYWGRRRMEYFEQIMKGKKTKSCIGMKRLAENRIDWRDATTQSIDF